jgi:cytochrome c biogenesis protein CcmG, thiol:disulfide interchange protein DsbE
VTTASETAAAPTRPSRWSRRVIGPFTLRHIAALLVVLLVGAALLVLLGLPVARSIGPQLPEPGSGFYQLGEPTQGPAVGQIAPELEGTAGGTTVTLDDLDGDPIRLADLRGAPVWLSFFGTWCPPCQEEVPVLRDAHARYAADGLRMVAISALDTSAADVRHYAETYSLPYTIGFDATSAVYRTYQGFGLPTHVFLDGDGVIRYVHWGPLSASDVDAIVGPLLAGTASAEAPV